MSSFALPPRRARIPPADQLTDPPSSFPALNSRLDTLAKILPSSFDLTPTFAAPLHPKSRAGPSNSSSIPRYALGLGLPSSSSSSKLAEEAEAIATNVWEDASESRIRELESLVQRGEAERVSPDALR